MHMRLERQELAVIMLLLQFAAPYLTAIAISHCGLSLLLHHLTTMSHCNISLLLQCMQRTAIEKGSTCTEV